MVAFAQARLEAGRQPLAGVRGGVAGGFHVEAVRGRIAKGRRDEGEGDLEADLAQASGEGLLDAPRGELLARQVADAVGPPDEAIARYQLAVSESQTGTAEPAVAADPGSAVDGRTARITGVRLLGEDGEERAAFRTGDPLSVRIDYVASESVKRPAFGIAFYALLGIAALTSSISLLEVVVSFFVDEWGWSREKSTWVLGTSCFLLAAPCAASSAFMNILVQIFYIYALAVGALFICLFVGWRWGTAPAVAEAVRTLRAAGRLHRGLILTAATLSCCGAQ